MIFIFAVHFQDFWCRVPQASFTTSCHRLGAAASQMAGQNDSRVAEKANVSCDSFAPSWHLRRWPLSGNLGAGHQEVTSPRGSWCPEQRCDDKGAIEILREFPHWLCWGDIQGIQKGCPGSAAASLPTRGTRMAAPHASLTPFCPGSFPKKKKWRGTLTLTSGSQFQSYSSQ